MHMKAITMGLVALWTRSRSWTLNRVFSNSINIISDKLFSSLGYALVHDQLDHFRLELLEHDLLFHRLPLTDPDPLVVEADRERVVFVVVEGDHGEEAVGGVGGLFVLVELLGGDGVVVVHVGAVEVDFDGVEDHVERLDDVVEELRLLALGLAEVDEVAAEARVEEVCGVGDLLDGVDEGHLVGLDWDR